MKTIPISIPILDSGPILAKCEKRHHRNFPTGVVPLLQFGSIPWTLFSSSYHPLDSRFDCVRVVWCAFLPARSCCCRRRHAFLVRSWPSVPSPRSSSTARPMEPGQKALLCFWAGVGASGAPTLRATRRFIVACSGGLRSR